MIYKIADFNFKMPKNRWIEAYVSDEYRLEENAAFDAEIAITEADVKLELSLAEKNGEKNVSVSRCVPLAFCRKVCEYALGNGAFLMHGVAVEYEGRGYLFTAQSGTGKTTHVLQWKKLFGDEKVTIVNGDKPMIRFIDGKVYAYGTPWNGKEHYGTNGRVELDAICFLERDENNSIKKISDTEALPRILSQIMVHDSGNLAKQLELVDALVEKVPMYLLKCNVSEEAARVAYEGMRASEEEK